MRMNSKGKVKIEREGEKERESMKVSFDLNNNSVFSGSISAFKKL